MCLGEAGPSSRLALDDKGRASIGACREGAAPPVPCPTETGVPSSPDTLILKRDTFAGPSCEEPCGSGTGLSLTHHMVHGWRAPIARVTVRDKGPESAHLGLHG